MSITPRVRFSLSAVLALVLICFDGAGSSPRAFRATRDEVPPLEENAVDNAWSAQGHVEKYVLAADGYVADFISTAATGAAMNDSGDVTGTSYPDPGCGSFCLPPLETVVWRRGDRFILPSIQGLTGIYTNSINNDGWVAGFAGYPYTITHAVVWQPNGDTYEAVDLGTLPGTTISYAAGIDNLGRVVGWSTTSNFPPHGAPFMWSESTGMIDLSTEGFPDESPLAISPGGTVATVNSWYRLGDPNSVVSITPPPQGFGIGGEPTAINDAGDQVRFLASTGPQNLRYLFRYHHEGTWQQISFSGNGNLSRYGVGSINNAGDVTATVLSTGVIAYGPDGLAESLAPLLSQAYQGSEITEGGPMNSTGQILTQVMIGRSPRLVLLTPAQTCLSGCIRITDLELNAWFVPDPSDPDHCYEGGIMHNEATVSLMVTRRNGTPVEGVAVSGRFLDDYWTNEQVSGVTNNSGVVSFPYTGLCGVGAIAFLVDDVSGGTLFLDRTTGILTDWAIPQ